MSGFERNMRVTKKQTNERKLPESGEGLGARLLLFRLETRRYLAAALEGKASSSKKMFLFAL